MEKALVYPVREVEQLSQHIQMVDEDRPLLAKLRAGALDSACTRTAAGVRLAEIHHAMATGQPVLPLRPTKPILVQR